MLWGECFVLEEISVYWLHHTFQSLQDNNEIFITLASMFIPNTKTIEIKTSTSVLITEHLSSGGRTNRLKICAVTTYIIKVNCILRKEYMQTNGGILKALWKLIEKIDVVEFVLCIINYKRGKHSLFSRVILLVFSLYQCKPVYFQSYIES